MPSYYCISVRFLDSTYHGRRDRGRPEWPPSPLRVFQAITSAAASRWRPSEFNQLVVPALTWLEKLAPPEIVTPSALPGNTSYRLYVPNNAADEIAASWVREAKSGKRTHSPSRLSSPAVGGDKLARYMADHRVEKDACPTRIHDDTSPTAYYVWHLDDEPTSQVESWMELLSLSARSLTHVGWGVDLVVGDGRKLSSEENYALDMKGFRWRPAPSGGITLRSPKCGTLAELRSRYDRFLNRLSDDGRTFATVPAVSQFLSVRYHSPALPSLAEYPTRPLVAFELRTPDLERFQPFDPARHACAVAGMVRNVLGGFACQMRPFGWTDGQIYMFVHGHTPDGTSPARGPDADHRFAYLPLPSLEPRGGAGVVVTVIRRVLVVGPPGGERQVAWARVLSGSELTPLTDQTPRAALRLLDRPIQALRKDRNLRPYIGEARVWSTVTPLVLPGHDEADPWIIGRREEHAKDEEARRRVREQAAARTERLLRRAFEQAGIPPELVQAASLEWSQVGFRAGLDLATRYVRPANCQLPRYHVRVRWPVPIRGPLAVGALRYRGLGVFAAE